MSRRLLHPVHQWRTSTHRPNHPLQPTVSSASSAASSSMISAATRPATLFGSLIPRSPGAISARMASSAAAALSLRLFPRLLLLLPQPLPSTSSASATHRPALPHPPCSFSDQIAATSVAITSSAAASSLSGVATTSAASEIGSFFDHLCFCHTWATSSAAANLIASQLRWPPSASIIAIELFAHHGPALWGEHGLKPAQPRGLGNGVPQTGWPSDGSDSTRMPAALRLGMLSASS